MERPTCEISVFNNASQVPNFEMVLHGPIVYSILTTCVFMI
jgi:hypothetical protein